MKPKVMLACIRCEADFAKSPTRPTPFCVDCRREVKTENDREFQRARRAMLWDIKTDPEPWEASRGGEPIDLDSLESLMGVPTDTAKPALTVSEFGQTSNTAAGDPLPIVPDELPHAHSPEGPWMGATAYFADVRGELAVRAKIAAGDLSHALAVVEAAVEANNYTALLDAVDVVGLTIEGGGWWRANQHRLAFAMNNPEKAAEYMSQNCDSLAA